MIPRLDPLYFRLRYLRFDESRKASVIIEMKLHRWAAVHFPPADMFFYIIWSMFDTTCQVNIFFRQKKAPLPVTSIKMSAKSERWAHG